jgi:hypothetical protein
MIYFSRMRSKGFSFYFGGLGVETCSLDVAFVFATLRSTTAWGPYGRAYSDCCKKWSPLDLKVWNVAQRRFAWQPWHFATFPHVSERVKSRSVWQAQYFCKVLRRWRPFFVASVILWRCPFIVRGRRSISDTFVIVSAAFWNGTAACGIILPLSFVLF